MALIKRITDEDVYRRRWQLLALTAVGAFMWPLDGSIVSVALPVMGPDLHLSFTAAVWVSAAFLLTTAVLLIPAGRIADQHGRVRYYLLGIAVFTVASLLCALSMNGAWLIGSRIIQGAGAALIGATSAAIVTSVFPPHERGRALGINVMAVYIGLTVGPPLGGFITDAVGWRWIFLINIPIGIVVLLWGWFMLPRSEKVPGPRLDVLGSVLLGAFLVCLLVPLTFSVEWGWASAATIGLLARLGGVLRRLRGLGAARGRAHPQPRPGAQEPPVRGRQHRRPAQLHGAVRRQPAHRHLPRDWCRTGRRRSPGGCC